MGVGNSLGLQQTVSDGIVSAVRDIPGLGKIVQSIAPISFGSSGSPVVNMKGGVIGITTLQITQGQNLNFALPSGRIDKLKTSKPCQLPNGMPKHKKKGSRKQKNFFRKGYRILRLENMEKGFLILKMQCKKNLFLQKHTFAWEWLIVASVVFRNPWKLISRLSALNRRMPRLTVASG